MDSKLEVFRGAEEESKKLRKKKRMKEKAKRKGGRNGEKGKIRETKEKH